MRIVKLVVSRSGADGLRLLHLEGMNRPGGRLFVVYLSMIGVFRGPIAIALLELVTLERERIIIVLKSFGLVKGKKRLGTS